MVGGGGGGVSEKFTNGGGGGAGTTKVMCRYRSDAAMKDPKDSAGRSRSVRA